MRGPFEYPQFCEDLGGGLKCAPFSDPDSDTALCIVWFSDYPSIVCTQACLVNEDELPTDSELEFSRQFMAEYNHFNRPGGDSVN